MPNPMKMELLQPFYAQRDAHGNSYLDEFSRSIHPRAAESWRHAQEQLMVEAGDDWPSDQPLIIVTSMTRSISHQYELAKKNARYRSRKFPNGIPTAKVGKSMHNFGLAVDINTRETMKRINEACIDMSFQEFRQYLAGFNIMGISSENWHFNFMLRESYASDPSWKLRERVYGENWTDLSDDEKEELLTLAGASGSNLSEKTVFFQRKYGDSLAVDGVPGQNTLRAAYCDWAHQNLYYPSN